MTPRCTYRLQLSPGFPFEAAASCAGYLSSLGVTHVYCSPLLQAAPGSAREAKTHTSWMDPVAAYEDAVTQFATSVMADAEFLGVAVLAHTQR